MHGQDMFGMYRELTPEELSSLYRMIKSGRDRAWSVLGDVRGMGSNVYGMITNASAVMTDIHNENQAR